MSKKPPKGPDYEVGYGKPPCHSQFKKGQSGNPAGRESGVPNTRSLIEKEGSEQMTITENGIQKVITKREATIKALYAKAMKGDVSAVKTLLEADRKNEGAAKAGSNHELTEADLGVLMRHADWVKLVEAAEAEVDDDETD